MMNFKYWTGAEHLDGTLEALKGFFSERDARSFAESYALDNLVAEVVVADLNSGSKTRYTRDGGKVRMSYERGNGGWVAGKRLGYVS